MNWFIWSGRGIVAISRAWDHTQFRPKIFQPPIFNRKLPRGILGAPGMAFLRNIADNVRY
jgi:hypothetical protein